MKPVLGIVGGFVLSLGMFVGGLAAATLLLTAEPERQLDLSLDVADLWPGQPRRVDTAAQDFERLPALQIAPDPSAEAQTAATGNAGAADPASGPLDAMETSSVQTAASEDPGQLARLDQLPSAHAEWCASRYRSYRPEDNSYTHYSGAIRPCVSPYPDDLGAAAERMSPAPSDPDSDLELIGDPSSPLLQYALNDGEGGSLAASDHASYCFSRYRSYRPEDNSYQPFGGGPRRRCR